MTSQINLNSTLSLIYWHGIYIETFLMQWLHLYIKIIRGSKNQSVSGVTTICLTQCNTSPSHRVDQVVDCGQCNVCPLLFNGCAKLLDIGRNRNALSYTPIQRIPNMLNGWHIRWVWWPCKNWDVFSFQELCTDPCKHGAVHYHAATWGDGRGWIAQQWTSGSRHGISVHSKMPSIKCTCVHCP